MKTLIIVNGPPASGKSTLAASLAAELDLPLLAKDSIKEWLFDQIGHHDREYGNDIGRAIMPFMWRLVAAKLKKADQLIIEANFHEDFAKDDVRTLRGHIPDLSVIEVFCTAPEEVLRKRFWDRDATSRHPGHANDPKDGWAPTPKNPFTDNALIVNTEENDAWETLGQAMKYIEEVS